MKYFWHHGPTNSNSNGKCRRKCPNPDLVMEGQLGSWWSASFLSHPNWQPESESSFSLRSSGWCHVGMYTFQALICYKSLREGRMKSPWMTQQISTNKPSDICFSLQLPSSQLNRDILVKHHKQKMQGLFLLQGQGGRGILEHPKSANATISPTSRHLSIKKTLMMYISFHPDFCWIIWVQRQTPVLHPV